MGYIYAEGVQKEGRGGAEQTAAEEAEKRARKRE